MKFSRKIKVEDDEKVININLKVNTDGKYLRRDESISRFKFVLTEVMKTLLEHYPYDEIKVRRG